MSTPIIQVDAFTAEPFKGNPAAVCLLSTPRDEPWMQAVAGEMNLSETAFLLPRPDGWSLRWFTPVAEVDLCGHATLASAHVLFQRGLLAASDVARFHTRSGLLTAAQTLNRIELDFPATPAIPTEAPAHLTEALGVTPCYIARSDFDYLVEVESEALLRELSPDFAQLRVVNARGVIVTARSDTKAFDFVSRFFAPSVGVNEDPVTGSAHCCLAPFWASRLGQQSFTAYQASRRGGILHVQLRGDRVLLAGEAVTVFEGTLYE